MNTEVHVFADWEEFKEPVTSPFSIGKILEFRNKYLQFARIQQREPSD